MYQIFVNRIVQVAEILGNQRALLAKEPKNTNLSPDLINVYQRSFENLAENLDFPELGVSRECVRDLREWINGGQGLTFGNLGQRLTELNRTIERELRACLCFMLDKSVRDLYENPKPFGDEVINRLPSTIGDVEEAAKCLALGRPTAMVFHLMRVMEIGVQEFGTKIGINLVSEKNWQSILNEVNRVIKSLPDKTPEEKHLRDLYAESAAHLYNVKLAWRNPVMHPKSTYTEDEGREIFNHVKSFIRQLAIRVL